MTKITGVFHNSKSQNFPTLYALQIYTFSYRTRELQSVINPHVPPRKNVYALARRPISLLACINIIREVTASFEGCFRIDDDNGVPSGVRGVKQQALQTLHCYRTITTMHTSRLIT